MYGYVIVVCLDTLCSLHSPLFLPVVLPLESLGCQGHVEGGCVLVPLV